MDLPNHHWVLSDPGNPHQDDSDPDSLTCIPGALTLRKPPAPVVLQHFLCVPAHAVQAAVIFLCCQGAAGSSIFYLPRPPEPFLQSCSPPPVPSLYHYKEFFLPGCRNLHLSLLNFTRFLFLIHPACLGPSASSKLGHLSLVSAANLNESIYHCLLQVINKEINQDRSQNKTPVVLHLSACRLSKPH